MFSSVTQISNKHDDSNEFPNQDINMTNHDINNSQSQTSTKTLTNSDSNKQWIYTIIQQEYNIIAEYKMLLSENLHGTYVIPSFESSLLWFGVIFVRSGFYEGGVFRFTITLPESFPDCDCPIVTFQSRVFHPAIDPNTGNLNLSEVFPKWTKSEHHIWQILKYVHWIFQNVNVKIPTNPEALKLYISNKVSFAEKTKESVVLSIDHLYDEPPTNDKHYITFNPYDPLVHDKIKECMLNQSKLSSNISSQGLSWVEPGSYRPFSKNESDTR